MKQTNYVDLCFAVAYVYGYIIYRYYNLNT